MRALVLVPITISCLTSFKALPIELSESPPTYDSAVSKYLIPFLKACLTMFSSDVLDDPYPIFGIIKSVFPNLTNSVFKVFLFALAILKLPDNNVLKRKDLRFNNIIYTSILFLIQI